jgi:hypothetical protein
MGLMARPVALNSKYNPDGKSAICPDFAMGEPVETTSPTLALKASKPA